MRGRRDSGRNLERTDERRATDGAGGFGMNFDDARKDAESRRIGPLKPSPVSVPEMTNEDAIGWNLIRKYSTFNDIEFAAEYGYWIPKGDC